MRCLRTGHSHEDLDQIFGQLCHYLARKAKFAVTPTDFAFHIQSWMDTSLRRPHERGRFVVEVDQARFWSLVGFTVKLLGVNMFVSPVGRSTTKF